MNSYKELVVWKKSIELAKEKYKKSEELLSEIMKMLNKLISVVKNQTP